MSWYKNTSGSHQFDEGEKRKRTMNAIWAEIRTEILVKHDPSGSIAMDISDLSIGKCTFIWFMFHFHIPLPCQIAELALYICSSLLIPSPNISQPSRFSWLRTPIQSHFWRIEMDGTGPQWLPVVGAWNNRVHFLSPFGRVRGAVVTATVWLL